jgi:mannose-6-phosphate isomerase-like protein (cupin superfamily)
MLSGVLLFSMFLLASFSPMATAATAATAAQDSQVFTQEKSKTWNREKLGGGTGVLYGEFAFTRNDAALGHTIKEIGWLTLLPGDSVGMHKHTDNEDAYIVIVGEGIFTETNGTKTRITSGDVTIARPGQSHAIENTGKVPLVFLCVIAKDSGK